MKKKIVCFMVLLFAFNFHGSEDLLKDFNTILKITNKDAQVKTLDEFIDMNKKNIPIIQDGKIVFLYQTDSTNKKLKVSVTSSENDFSESKDFLKRIGMTNYFYIQMKPLKADNFSYSFIVHENDKKSIKKDDFNSTIHFAKRYRNCIRTIDSDKSTLQIVNSIDADNNILLKRSVYVLLPPGYFKNTDVQYPVFYMHDGNNLWDSKESPWGGWKMDSTSNEMINNGTVQPMIIVGIANTGKRMDEYIGFSTMYSENEERKKKVSAKALQELSMAYVDYVIKSVKPYIDANYRTLSDRNNTVIGGSSAGAMISLYMGFKYPEVFSGVAAISGGFEPYVDLRENFFNSKADLKIYLDCGGKDMDKDMLVESNNLYDFLKKNGYRDNENLLYIVDNEAGHNEKSWANRAPGYLKFFYGK